MLEDPCRLVEFWKTLQISTFILPDPKSYLIQYSGVTNEELKYNVALGNKMGKPFSDLIDELQNEFCVHI